jgi:signal transduction histidine kinase
VYRDLRTSFDHLDGYLSLFTPLQRRLERKRVEIIGADIERFITELFSERLERHHVRLEATSRFRDHRFVGFPSTFYPVFVNLVDNAIWWLGDRPRRDILLQARDGVMSVIDSGPGVPERDLDRIFEFGFTRKPDGRGTGLYVSRQVLRRENFDLRVRADDREGLGGAAFDIVAPPSSEATK